MCLYQCQNAAWVICFCAQELGDCGDVLHQAGDVAECVMVDPLQDVAASARRDSQIGDIDVPAAIRLAGNRFSVQPEATQHIK